MKSSSSDTPSENTGRYRYGSSDTSEYASFSGPPEKGIRDYVLILRERFWYILVVFLAVFSAALVYNFTRTNIYEATAVVEVRRTNPVVLQVQDVMDETIRSTEDLNTQVRRLESGTIIQRVADRLSGEEMRRFMAPYETGSDTDPLLPIELLGRNRKVLPLRLSLTIAIQYRHPDPEIAALVANLFAEEFIAFNVRMRTEESMKAMEDLRIQADRQRRNVEELEMRLQNYRERNNLVALDQRRDIVTEKLKMTNMMLTEAMARFREAENRHQQVQAFLQEQRPLTEISFIANLPLVNELQGRVAAQQINIAQLSERYRHLHPRMIEAVNSLRQTEQELENALRVAASRIENEFHAARRSVEEARTALTVQEREALDLDRVAVEYRTLEDESEVNKVVFQAILARMREVTTSSTIERQNATIVDRARPPMQPSSPNTKLNLALGLVGGLGLGLGFAFFVAFLDDRVKSAFDVESVVGLPLIGVIPEIRRMETFQKAQIALNEEDKQVAESFRTLHSSMRLHEDSKNAQILLVTSTAPGEGKTFLASNLALTFAMHGEKTLLIDCDLRKPNVHKSLQLDNTKGVIDYLTGKAPFEDLLQKGLHRNLDVIVTGGRAKHPSQSLNSPEFEKFIQEARNRYQRILLDTPPITAVSDALLLLPLVDGSLFTIKFNRVRRKAAQYSVKRLLESNVPVFGAVLNGLNLGLAGYYYAEYHDKSYRDYYVVPAGSAEGGDLR